MSRILSIILMNNPRDFLPAKYKKNQTAEDFNDSIVPNISKNKPLEEKIDSPWSDLAKKPEVPEYRSALPVEKKAEERDQIPANSLMATDLTKKAESTKSTFIPKKRPNTKLAGLLVVFFLVIGLFSSYLLSKEGQDNRQQASGCSSGEPYCVCGYNGSMFECRTVTPTPTPAPTCNSPSSTCSCAYNGSSMECHVVASPTPSRTPTPSVTPRLTLTPPPNVDPQRFGWCGGCNPPRPATQSDWANMNVQISGTYIHNGMRYVIDLPATHEASVIYASNWPGVNQYVGDPDGVGDVELAPFYMCGSGSGYNTLNCSIQGILCSQSNAATNGCRCSVIENGRCYLTQAAYEAELALGHTWVPDGTGCGEGATVGGINTDSIDCVEYHFTTCLNQGTGVNGYGCDAEDNGTIDEDDDDDTTTTTTPPITTTVTQPPTVTTTAPGPVCSNIELLDSTGNAMTGDDDENLKNGDQIRLRATATNVAGATVTYEFRIWAPNMSTWINLTNTNAGSSAPNVSAAYTINSSGHFVAQSRICVSGVCQAWETVAGAPSTIQTGSACTTDANCAAGYYCYIDPTPSGAQTLVAPTGNYCKAKQICTTDANCAAGQTCYQPPMPTCPSGMSCTQVMPAKFCKEQ